MFRALRAMAGEPEGKALVIAALLIIASGTIVYSALEGWSLLDALYFSVVTLATVGFGDLHPTTDVGKLFTVFYILSGIGILAAFVSELARHRAAPVAKRLAAAHLRGQGGGSDAGEGPADSEDPDIGGESEQAD